jgi:hypothetical protein
MLSAEQFTKYCKICSANVVGQDGHIRYTYKQLREALVTHNELDIFDSCLQFAGIVPQDSLERTTLLLLLLDIHMTYKLVTRELITQDESVMDLKSLFIDQLDETESESANGEEELF